MVFGVLFGFRHSDFRSSDLLPSKLLQYGKKLAQYNTKFDKSLLRKLLFEKSKIFSSFRDQVFVAGRSHLHQSDEHVNRLT
jgi:hypothetical protein